MADTSHDMHSHAAGHEADNHSIANEKDDNGSKSNECFLRSIPCGKQPTFTASFFQDLKFLNLAAFQLISPSSCKTIHTPRAETLKSLSVLPPVPPPEKPLLV
jgi:hypothetical protein